jgi:hypothetical protein
MGKPFKLIKYFKMKTNWKVISILAVVLMTAFFAGCDKNESEENEIDYSQFKIINNGTGAVEAITDPNDTDPLEIVQTIPSLGNLASNSAPSARQGKDLPLLRAAQTTSIGSFPANLPIMFFFNDKIYLNSVKDNIEIIVDEESIKGVIAINEGANGYAILTFTPWKEFTINKTISVTVKKGIQDKGGNKMLADVKITYQTSKGSNGNFDGNKGFEKGDEGLVFIGDGAVITGEAPLLAQEGQSLAAISSGEAIVSESGYAIGNTSSMVILGPISKSISSVSFYYDFISAEFNDYVNTEFDDCAMITVYGPKGSYSEFINSVNKIGYSNTAFSGFPKMPDGGDNYAGHIGWTSRKINFSEVGSPAYITFTVTDVSDQILSSILAIDNISF